MKTVKSQSQWHVVSKELEEEKLKLASYDGPLLDHIGNVSKKKILDYGCGPGVLALALTKLHANVKVFDISKEMSKLAGEKIGNENVYKEIVSIPKDHFDFLICNLVLCINGDDEVRRIVNNITKVLKRGGKSFIGFCNPEIFNFPESKLDIRFPTGNKYEENHIYKKLKKEGNYEILETHRPKDWYLKVFREAGLKHLGTIFTPEYKLKGRKIKDFVIFELSK